MIIVLSVKNLMVEWASYNNLVETQEDGGAAPKKFLQIGFPVLLGGFQLNSIQRHLC